MTVMIMQLGQVFVTGEEPAHRDVFDVGVIFDLILDQILPLFPFPLCGTLQVQQRLIQGCIPTTGNMASTVVQVQTIWTAPGPERAKALSAFHTFTGADSTTDNTINTGSSLIIGKATCISDVTEHLLSRFILYTVSIASSSRASLIWDTIFSASYQLPPTPGALKQCIHKDHGHSIMSMELGKHRSAGPGVSGSAATWILQGHSCWSGKAHHNWGPPAPKVIDTRE